MTEIKFTLLVAPDLFAEVPFPDFDPDDHSWEQESACREGIESHKNSPWTDPENTNQKRIAEKTCWLECSVRQQCLTAGLLPVWEPVGIYGGRNANQRRLLKRHWREQDLIPDDIDEGCDDPDMYFGNTF